MIKNELQIKIDKIIEKGWVKCSNNNSGNVGLLLERLLGLQNHNFPIPDYDGIEIKTKTINGNSMVSLFKATPDSYLYEIKRIHKQYGYPDKNNPNFNVFQLSFFANKKTFINKYLYAYLYVDKLNQKVTLNFYNLYGELIDNKTSWSFKMLQEKIALKLTKLCIVFAERKYINKLPCCRYLNYNFYNCKDFDFFLKSLNKGHIRITFTIGVFKSGKRYGQIHDHGTGFDIDINYINDLFEVIS